MTTDNPNKQKEPAQASITKSKNLFVVATGVNAASNAKG